MTDQYAVYPSLKHKTVFVTGGASGIGAEIVKAFLRQGSRVGFVDLDRAAAETLLNDADGNCAFRSCDLRNIDDLKSAFVSLREELGPASVLINNAARDDRHDWREVTPDYWDERMATNLRHQFFAIQAVAPDMIDAGGGSIINLGSISWWLSMGDMPAYTTSKAAVHGLTRAMARDLGEYRIRVNCVVPGWIMTQRQKELWATPTALTAHLERQCLPAPIPPTAVAPMVLFLAADDASMITASNFFVDAGST